MARSRLSFLFPDEIHFHERSFKSLFQFLEKHDVPHVFLRDHRELKLRYGDYREEPAVRRYVPVLEDLDKDALFSFSYQFRACPLRIYPLVQAEALCFLLATRENWYGSPLPGDPGFIFNKMYEEDRDTLLLNMAAAMFWIDYMETELAHHPNFTHCCIFGGSAIYGKVLTKLLMTTCTKVIMMESSFTGNEYYFEEKYEPIANNCDIRFRAVYESIRLPENPNRYDRERIRAANRVLAASNKNVTQPAEIEAFEPFACPDEETVLVIGQVQNDFSLLEAKLPNINSIYFYRSLIRRLLDHTDVNILFKAHPWEHKKTHLRKALTRMEIERLHSSLPPNDAERIRILEDSNIRQLFDVADYVIALNSQSSLEAAFYSGLKPIVFGRPFYGQKGFTSDYDDLDKFFQDFLAGRVNGTLSLREFAAFEEFLTKWLEYHLVTVNPLGVSQLETKLSMLPPIPLATPQLPTEVAADRKGSSAVSKRAGSIGTRRWARFSARLQKLRRDPHLFMRERGLTRVGPILSFFRYARWSVRR